MKTEAFELDRVHLELTSRCNFDCEFCPQGAMERPRGDMDFALFERLAAEVAEQRVAPALAFHLMGEPLLYPRLADALGVTRQRGLRALVTTNGSLLGEALAREMSTAEPHFVAVSLQTPDPASFALRGQRALSYEAFRERVLDGLRALLALSPETRVSVALLTTPLKWALYPATRGLTIVDTTRALQARVRVWVADLRHALGGVHPLFDESVLERGIRRLRVWRQNRLDLSPRLAIETRVVGDWGRRARDGRGRVAHPARVGTCHGLREHIGVLWDGTYTYCCTDYEGRTSPRNARDLGIREFLALPEVQMDRLGFARWRVRNAACQHCLGGPTRFHRSIRQAGSIVYQTVYRQWFQDPLRYREG